jgi:hypothetical protein
MRATLAVPTCSCKPTSTTAPAPAPAVPVSTLRGTPTSYLAVPPWVVPSFAPSSTTCRPAACIHRIHPLLPSPRRLVRPCLPQHRSRTCAAYTYGNRPQPAPLSLGATRSKPSFPGCPLSSTLFATHHKQRVCSNCRPGTIASKRRTTAARRFLVRSSSNLRPDYSPTPNGYT